MISFFQVQIMICRYSTLPFVIIENLEPTIRYVFYRLSNINIKF